MKKWTIIALLLLAVLVSGCNLPGSTPASPQQQDDAMATEISRILTGTPVKIEPSATPEIEEETPVEEPEMTQPEEEATEAIEDPQEEVQPTETAQPAPTSTPEPTPTATLSATDPTLTLGQPDWVDTMDNGDNWPTGYSEYTSIKFENGYLKFTANTELDGWRLSWPYLEDFYLEIKLQSTKCSGNDRSGLMFRAPASPNWDKGYLFGLTCDGRYSLRRFDGHNVVPLVNWTEDGVIKTGDEAVNVLGVMAKGANLTLYINGEKVKEITDNTYLNGGFGVFAGGVKTGELTVWVDQIRYWKIP
ncbi:MAG: hypothetical protein ACOX7C_01275 [Brevefilum sp.]|jgi:hypothetical protein